MTVETFLQRFERFGIHLGLEASYELLAALDNPQEQVPIIHVAGSNGKGSVCAYLSAILTQTGYRVGRFISPHLVDWTERICINDRPIAAEELMHLLEQVEAAIDPSRPSPTQFEVITAAAWLYFAQQQVDLAVMEVGLGGRLDATNVVDRPLVSIITSLSREHWQRLGPTLADIAGEKAGILKPNCPAVIGPIPSEAAAVVNRKALELKCPTFYPPPARPVNHGWAEYSGTAAYPFTEEVEGEVQSGYLQIEQCIRYPLKLQGAIQLQNSALAIAALQLLRLQGWDIDDEDIVQGMNHVRWPGRLQWTTWQGQKLLIDGAHNPASAEVLRQFVDDLPEQLPLPSPVTWVMGMLSTKDHEDIFRVLLRGGDRLFLLPVPGHSSADPEQLATLAQTVCPSLGDCQVYPDLETGLEMAFAQAGRLTVLCGSLYLLGEFLTGQRN